VTEYWSTTDEPHPLCIPLRVLQHDKSGLTCEISANQRQCPLDLARWPMGSVWNANAVTLPLFEHCCEPGLLIRGGPIAEISVVAIEKVSSEARKKCFRRRRNTL